MKTEELLTRLTLNYAQLLLLQKKWEATAEEVAKYRAYMRKLIQQFKQLHKLLSLKL